MINLVCSKTNQLILILVISVLSGRIEVAAQVTFSDQSDVRGILENVIEVGFGAGIAAFDFDQDGDIDLFLPQRSGSPDRLYLNDGLGNFTDIAGSTGLDVNRAGRSAMWFDYDDDHLVDLLIGSDCFSASDPNCAEESTLRLYRQSSPGNFEEVTEAVGLNSVIVDPFLGHRSGMAAGDIDNDGDLDLIVGQWDGQLILYVNNAGVFSEETLARGITNPQAPGSTDPWQSVMQDFNGDGWIDIFTSVDFAPNHLWINQGDGTFVDEGASSGVDFAFNDMGVTIGDYDNDCDFDIYVTNIFDGGKHNLLLRNDSADGVAQFTERALEAGVDETGFGWGATFFDANNDTLLDLAVTNGWFNGVGFSDFSRMFLQNPDAPGNFLDISDESGFYDDFYGSCLISADVNRDGDLDLLQVCNPALFEGPFRVLENQHDELTIANNWLVVRPRQAGKNHWCFGAKVTVEIGELRMCRDITSSTSIHGQQPAEAFFGLGDVQSVDRVIVTWPMGDQTVWEQVSGQQVFDAKDADLNLDGVLNLLDVGVFVDSIGNCTGNCQADFNNNGSVDLLDVSFFVDALVSQ